MTLVSYSSVLVGYIHNGVKILRSVIGCIGLLQDITTFVTFVEKMKILKKLLDLKFLTQKGQKIKKYAL